MSEVALIPHCFDCRIKLILTEFSNGVIRIFCPKCKKKIFCIQKDGGVAMRANIFEITEAQGYFT